MEELREKRKKGILRKTWERCKSFGHLQNPRHPMSPRTLPHTSLPVHPMVKSKSWSTFFPSTPIPSSPRSDKRVRFKKFQGGSSVPHGCFSVYVGPDKQRFVVKVKCTNHPLFRSLLEEAELEYGFHSDGPLVLPCDVDVFIKVMFEMDDDHGDDIGQSKCSFPKNRNSYHHLTPPRLVSFNQYS